jgi:hypothetical protein
VPQIPIQTGVRVKDGSFRKSYPLNLRHKIVESGLSKGELVAAHGARQLSTGPGADRGGTVWEGKHYRVMGTKLVRVAANGTATELGTLVSDGLNVGFAHGFDQLAIASSQRLYYWNDSSLAQVTDPDLGLVIDVTWIDGYFVTTDGEHLIVTELNDPTAVDPLKYGSAETVPDPVVGVDVLREELVAIGRYSLQFFRNVGGNGFPFQNVRGAMIPYGAVSARAKCRILGTLAFVGSGVDEPLGVFIVSAGAAVRISDEEIEAILAECADETAISVEARSFGDETQLVVHAGEASVAISLRGSQEADAGLWHRLSTNGGAYRPRNAVWVHSEHFVGDCTSGALGVLDDGLTAHFGEEPGWSFDAGLLYNDGRGFILREVEITGQFPQEEGAVFFSMTRDGGLWSNEVSLRLTGRRDQRVVWRPNVRCGRMAGFRFRGHGRVAVARTDAQGEPLNA